MAFQNRKVNVKVAAALGKFNTRRAPNDKSQKLLKSLVVSDK